MGGHLGESGKKQVFMGGGAFRFFGLDIYQVSTEPPPPPTLHTTTTPTPHADLACRRHRRPCVD
jgi:hypothetical protein